MPNVVKYSLTTQANSLKKGNVVLGINSVEYGPTSATGYWNGIEAPAGGYVMYIPYSNGNGMTIYSMSNNTELIKIVNEIGLQSFTTAAEALAWTGQQTGLFLVNKAAANIVTDGLVISLDAGFLPSYPATGNTWYGLGSANANGTLTNGPTYSNGSISFDGTDDYVNVSCVSNTIRAYNSSTEFTIKLPLYSGGQRCILSYRSAGTMYIGKASGGIFVYYNPLNVPAYIVGNITNGAIVHCVVICDAANNLLSTYINGTLAGSVSRTGWSTTFNNTIGLGFDLDGGTNEYMDGDMYLFRHYNRTLSASEILQNYYQAPIVTDSLVLAVDAGNLVSYESGSATVYPLAGSINGTLINGTSFSSGNGGYWSFDGANDYISWGDNFDLTATSISGTVWGWANSLNSYLPWIDKLGSNGNYRFHADSAGRLILGIRNTANDYHELQTASLISTNQWYYLAFTFDNSTREGKIYLNGELVGTKIYTIDRNDTSTPLQTGYQANNGGTLNGRIATLSLYNKALTQQEIQRNFNAQRARFGV